MGATALQTRLATAREENRAALVGYIPAGFPDLESSVPVIEAMAEGGCDVIEVGLPYSDPMMDGPTIQHAAGQALAAGTNTEDLFRIVEATAATGAVAVVMSYWNPIERYGVERFATQLARAGGSGVITPDLIPEEAEEWTAASESTGLDRIYLVAPSSSDQRLVLTTQACSGFVYAASVMGVTGTREHVADTAEILVRRTRDLTQETKLPICVGLGISNAEQAAEVAAYADGVIVGAGFCQRVLDAPDLDTARTAVRSFAQELAAGVRAR